MSCRALYELLTSQVDYSLLYNWICFKYRNRFSTYLHKLSCCPLSCRTLFANYTSKNANKISMCPDIESTLSRKIPGSPRHSVDRKNRTNWNKERSKVIFVDTRSSSRDVSIWTGDSWISVHASERLVAGVFSVKSLHAPLSGKWVHENPLTRQTNLNDVYTTCTYVCVTKCGDRAKSTDYVIRCKNYGGFMRFVRKKRVDDWEWKFSPRFEHEIFREYTINERVSLFTKSRTRTSIEYFH